MRLFFGKELDNCKRCSVEAQWLFSIKNIDLGLRWEMLGWRIQRRAEKRFMMRLYGSKFGFEAIN